MMRLLSSLHIYIYIYIVYTILCRYVCFMKATVMVRWICTTGLYHFILHYSFQTYLFKIYGVYTYRTAVHLKSGHQWLGDSLVHQNPSGLQALDVPQAAMAALLPMTFWRREASQHKENKLNKLQRFNTKGCIDDTPLSNFCCILTCLTVKIIRCI